MTLEEMQTIARIISMADGGCANCIHRLISEISRAFPEFKLELTDEMWTRPLVFDDGEVLEGETESYPIITVSRIGDETQHCVA